MKSLRQRKNIRLQGYDYSQPGRYFVTICTKNRINLFGEIMNKTMFLTEYGKIAENELLNIPFHYQNVEINKFVIMPNHVHIIVVIKSTEINSTERINPFPTKKADIPNIVGKYKAGVTRIVGNAFMRSDIHFDTRFTIHSEIWQSRYHEQIIRNKEAYQKIYKYIETNVMQWELDCHNPLSPKYKDWNEDE